jgi:NTE family protein
VAHKKIGLALGSGGARGWAHIGVIRALQDSGIKIDFVAGTSIGAFVGAIYAADGLDELEKFVRAIDWKTIVSLLDLEFPTQGLLDGGKVYELLQNHLLEMQIEDTKIPFCCVATDLLQKQAITLKSGLLVDAVRASISIPGIFTPFEKDGTYYIDGGVINPVPVDIVKEMGCDLAIAVNLNYSYLDMSDEAKILSEQSNRQKAQAIADPEHEQHELALKQSTNQAIENESAQTERNQENSRGDRQNNSSEQLSDQVDASEAETSQVLNQDNFMETFRLKYESVQEALSQKINHWMPEAPPEPETCQCPNIFDVIGSAINIMEQQVTQVKLEADPPDILIQPNLSKYGIFDFHCAEQIIQEGYDRTKSLIPEIKRLLEADQD